MAAAAALRHVERSRHKSTCAFADDVARAAIAAYRAIPPPRVEPEEEGLTVLSAVLLLQSAPDTPGDAPPSSLRVVALGAGTKYPPAAARATADAATLVRPRRRESSHAVPCSTPSQHSLGRGPSPVRSTAPVVLTDTRAPHLARRSTVQVHDCHAEVLARRAFRLFLAREVALGGESTVLEAGAPLPGQHRATHYGGADDSENAPSSRLQLRKGLTVHLYSSSMPCGNACVL
jgi:hypothetical protein